MDEALEDVATTAEPDAASGGTSRWRWAGAATAVLVAAALVGWIIGGRLAARRDELPAGVPVAATAEQLASLPGEVGHAVYWIGPVEGTTYELTRTADGNVYIRYLPTGSVDAAQNGFTTVGTYPDPAAWATLQAAAKKPGAVVRNAGTGALIVSNTSRPTSVYFGFKDWPYLMEVYDPDPQRALELVTSGQAQPLR